MATFVKLTGLTNPKAPSPVYVNLDRVQWMQRKPPTAESTYMPALPERTVIWFQTNTESRDGWDFEEVAETPDEILYQMESRRVPS